MSLTSQVASTGPLTIKHLGHVCTKAGIQQGQGLSNLDTETNMFNNYTTTAIQILNTG